MRPGKLKAPIRFTDEAFEVGHPCEVADSDIEREQCMISMTNRYQAGHIRDIFFRVLREEVKAGRMILIQINGRLRVAGSEKVEVST